MPKMMSQRQFKQAVQRIMFRKPTVRRCLQCEIEGGSPGRPIQAHSVQANGPLKAICGRHNTVATFYGFFLPRNQGQPSDRGIRMASTFLGLCSTHDNALFHTIDTEPFCGNHQQMLAVMFRGLCWELYLKYDVVQRFEEILGLCERERRFQEREGFLASLEGQKKGISESKGILHDLYHMRTGEQSLDLHGWWGEFSGPSVLAGAGAVNPIFGEDGQALQNPRADLAWVAHYVTVQNDRTHVIFVWRSSDLVMATFVRQWVSIVETHEQRGWPNWFFLNCENMHFNRDWWDDLNLGVRQHITAMAHTGLDLVWITNQWRGHPVDSWQLERQVWLPI